MAPPLRVHALFFGLLATLLTAEVPWPLPFALPVLLLVALRGRSAAVREATTWLRGGELDRGTLLFAAGVAVVSSGALVLWFTYGDADVSDIVAMVPPSSVSTLVAIAVVFSVANAGRSSSSRAHRRGTEHPAGTRSARPRRTSPPATPPARTWVQAGPGAHAARNRCTRFGTA